MNADRRLCLQGLLAAALGPLAASRAVGDVPSEAATAAQVRIVFVGDVMLADGPGRLVRRGGDPFAPSAPLFAGADLRVANLECVVARGGQPEDKPWTFRADPRVVGLLKRRFDAVSVANNHSGDFGRAAFAEMLGRLRAAGLPYFGGGLDLAEAHRPLVVERNGLRIALLGYDEYFPRHFEAGHDHPGVAWSEDHQVVADIRRARDVDRADLVVPFMHWGVEQQTRASDRQRELARRMIDAGADAVVGTHPHVVQDVEFHRGRPIVYSLGNFVFDGFDDAVANTGWALRLDLARDGVRRASRAVVRIDRDGTPHPAEGYVDLVEPGATAPAAASAAGEAAR